MTGELGEGICSTGYMMGSLTGETEDDKQGPCGEHWERTLERREGAGPGTASGPQ